jgi:hypothetical protein
MSGSLQCLATGAPLQQVLVETLSGLLALAWVLALLVLSVAGLGALCVVAPALLPGRVIASARASAEHPWRSTLLGAINLIGALLLAALLARLGGPFGLVALGVLTIVGYFAVVGVAGIGGAVARFLAPGKEIGPVHTAAGGALLALACFFPILGQIFGLLCLCCAIGSAVTSARAGL